MVKVDKNRYAVSGLNQTTDPYTQVIKLVDSQLRPVSTVTFRLPGKDSCHGIKAMAMVRRSALVAMSGETLVHVLQRWRRRLAVVQANIQPFRDVVSSFSMLTRAVGKLIGVVKKDDSEVAVIKLTFH